MAKSYRVYWGDMSKGTYLYGTELRKTTDDIVYFKNPYMSSGSIIKKWSSKTNYTKDKTQPLLPVLFEGKKYKIQLIAKTIPEDRAKLKIAFFNSYDEEIDSFYINDEIEYVEINSNVDYYTIECVNYGLFELEFRHINIIEMKDYYLENEEDEIFILGSVNNPSKEVNIVFEEPHNKLKEFDFSKYENIENIYLIKSDEYYAKMYSTEKQIKKINELIEELDSKNINIINLISYGPVGNFAVKRINYEMKKDSNIYSYITKYFYQKNKYKKVLINTKTYKDIENILNHKDKKIEEFNIKSEFVKKFPIIASTLDYRNQLSTILGEINNKNKRIAGK